MGWFVGLQKSRLAKGIAVMQINRSDRNEQESFFQYYFFPTTYPILNRILNLGAILRASLPLLPMNETCLRIDIRGKEGGIRIYRNEKKKLIPNGIKLV